MDDFNKTVIVSARRTPIGSFLGLLSHLTAIELGSLALKAALNDLNLEPNEIEEFFLGNVLQANLGQSPARQVAVGAGLDSKISCTTINKVCASGLKAVSLACQSIIAGTNKIVATAGTESMSNTPFYLENLRKGIKFGDQKAIDSLMKDGLINPYDGQHHMGYLTDICAKNEKITREQQDEFAILSYKRSAKAWEEKKFDREIVDVLDCTGKYKIREDEEYKKVKFEKFQYLRPAFLKDGTITAANASKLSDGGSALIVMDHKKAKELNVKPLSKIIDFCDASLEPEKFPLAPERSIRILLDRNNLTVNDIDYFEINEAFAAVPLISSKLLHIPIEKINIYGGGVSLGHPLGSSGSRILVTLINVLKQNNGRFGICAICNGGGGSTAMLIENVN